MSRFTPAARARLRRPQVQIGVLMPPPGKEFGQHTRFLHAAHLTQRKDTTISKFGQPTTPARVRPLLTSRRHPTPGANVYTPDQYRVAQKKS